MKKILTITIILIAITTATAQSKKIDIEFGMRGGLNFSTIISGEDNYENTNYLTSFYGGLVAEAAITKRFSAQTEIFYSGQGFTVDLPAFERDAEFQLDYIQIPLLAKFYITKGFSVAAGPQFGFKVNEEINAKPFADAPSFNTNSIKDFDLQGTLGAEYKFESGVFFQARYSYGFSQVIENVNVHNSVLSTGVGFMF